MCVCRERERDVDFNYLKVLINQLPADTDKCHIKDFYPKKLEFLFKYS